VRQVKAALAKTRVKVGAQNMHWADAGAWTGEISPVMLRDCGLDLIELGHSERREHFGETDKTVGLKTAAAVRHGFVPLICVGETLAEREAGRADEVLTAQVLGALQGLADNELSAEILFAYEPVWAIGEKGIPASADYADKQQALIKRVAASRLPAAPLMLYGGSVNPGNAAELIGQPHIDGLFIGRSAWQAEGYIDILKKTSAAIAR
jgi:triosephosphate isomerase